MEWMKISACLNEGENRRREEEEERGEEMLEGVLYVKVMTDEQMEILRRQIAVYATICEQLVEMHKSLSAQQDSLAGMRFGNLYCDPTMGTNSHKIGSRQRWTPTPMQLQILETIFEQGNGTPSKQKIKEVTIELGKHGQISETNVYNWFQNRRARSKRKQGSSALPSINVEAEGTEGEGDNEIDSERRDKRAKSNEEISFYKEIGSESLFFQGTDNFVEKTYYSGIDHFMEKMDDSCGL